MTRTTIVMAAALAFAAALSAVSAQAQSIRTFVSTAGTDNPSCSLAAPCRHFQAAVNATAAGGEVDALDAGAYGSFTIGQAISIEGQGWSYVAPPANGVAIDISMTGSGNINIRGVSLNGVGAAGNTIGIKFTSAFGGGLNVQNSVIRNFSQDGIFIHPNASTPTQLSVSNTLVSDNGTGGIDIQPSGTGTVAGVLDHVAMENNLSSGLVLQSSSAQILSFTVSDSVIANNGASGIITLASGATINVMVRNSTIAKNDFGLTANGAGSFILVTRSTITGNNTAWANFTSGVVTSYVDNNIDGNGSANTTPGSTASYH